MGAPTSPLDKPQCGDCQQPIADVAHRWYDAMGKPRLLCRDCYEAKRQ